MLERALLLRNQEVARGQNEPTHRSVRTSAVLRDLARRMTRILRAVGAFFAAGGAMS